MFKRSSCAPLWSKVLFFSAEASGCLPLLFRRLSLFKTRMSSLPPQHHSALLKAFPTRLQRRPQELLKQIEHMTGHRHHLSTNLHVYPSTAASKQQHLPCSSRCVTHQNIDDPPVKKAKDCHIQLYPASQHPWHARCSSISSYDLIPPLISMLCSGSLFELVNLFIP